MTDATAVASGFPILALLLGLLSAGLLGSAVLQLLQRRWVASTTALFWSFSLGLAAIVGTSLIFNLHTWQRLTAEQAIATLTFSQLNEQQFLVQLALSDGRALQLPLQGNDWQLDARVLKLSPAANLLGMDARFRLERLSSRYRDIAVARETPPSVHDLSNGEGHGLSLVRLLQERPGLRRWLDTWHGSATYMPMAHGARYTVTLTQSGLLARPDNPAAQAAMERWL